MTLTTEQIVNLIVSVVVQMLACGGFWTFVIKKYETNSAKNKLLLGLAHDRIMSLGNKYIVRGDISRDYSVDEKRSALFMELRGGCCGVQRIWEITSDEFENLNDYLYEPYIAMNGNGSAKKIMEDVKKLKIVNYNSERGNKQ